MVIIHLEDRICDSKPQRPFVSFLRKANRLYKWNRVPAGFAATKGDVDDQGLSYNLTLEVSMGVLATIFALVATAAVASAAPQQETEGKDPVKHHYPCKKQK